MATWPSELPQCFNLGSYREQMPGGVIRDEYETGPAGTRLRSTAAPFPVSGALYLTNSQWLVLDEFYRDEAGRGSVAFEFPRQTPSGDSPEEPWAVRFTSPPDRSAVDSDLFLVNIALEVLP